MRGKEVEAALREAGARQVHHAFRVIVCGDTPESAQTGPSRNWIDSEVATLFHFHVVSDLPVIEQNRSQHPA
eukprot:g26834.t1